MEENDYSPKHYSDAAHRKRVIVGIATCAIVVAVIALVVFLIARPEGPTSSVGADEPAADTSNDQTSEETEAEPEPEPEEPVEARATTYEMEGSAADAVRATNANGILTQAIGAFEDKGYTVAFVVHDVNTGNELTYNCDQELYPASSIKGPFTTCVYQMLVETGQVSLDQVTPVAEITILESSDEGYRTLHRMFGETAFIQWLKDAGVEPGSYGSYESMVSWNYPHISARQLELMWEHIYDYLTTTDSEASRQLADLFERREVSSLRKAVGTDIRTWSKMGWFESFSNYRSEPATVEAGTVFADNGPYVFAVLTTAPAELDDLVPLLSAVNRAHQDMA